MFRSLMKKWKEKWGFTMTEVMVVVGIIAVVAAIAIPSAIAIRNSLQFQERNNYARSIFLAAQSELMEMRSSGELGKLPAVNDEVGSSNTAVVQEDGEATPSGYIYTTSADTTYFNMILPAGAVDETVRGNQIIIEYSPTTGNVYAVFYSDDTSLVTKYMGGQLSRDEDERKDIQLGYYDGSDLADPDLGLYSVEADIVFENGHEGVVTVVVPAQAQVSGGNINFMGDNYNAYANGLEVTLTITGEQGGTFTKVIKTYGNSDNCTVSSSEGGVNAIFVSCTLDSLAEMGSFASLPENNILTDGEAAGLRALTDIDAGDYVIKPGDNVSITAEVTFRPGVDDPMVIIENAAIAGVNPMFDSLTPGTNGYILAVSNGRNLQNLNAIAPEIAKNVEAVVFNPSALGKPAESDPEYIIDWSDTVAYYNNKYGTGTNGYTSTAEAPARALPYFVPIHNEYLFGTVRFQTDGTNQVPMWVEVNRRDNNVKNADIVGNGVKIYNLDIDTSKYLTNKDFYAGSDGAANHRLAGLFGYVNAHIHDVSVVNAIVRGQQLVTDGQTYPSAAGALIGVAGKNTRISNCGVYIDTEAVDFVRTSLNMGSFTGAAGEYGVSGYGAVGGLVGYIKAVPTDNSHAQLVTDSFAAVPVSGAMNMATYCGYFNGVGGFVGNAQQVGFQNCYASGYAASTNCAAAEDTSVEDNYLGIAYSGENSVGVGGFAGVSHGSDFKECFATGDVRGNGDSTGAFVGVMCFDSALGDGRTQINTCYAVGETLTPNPEGFSGIHAIIDPVHITAEYKPEKEPANQTTETKKYPHTHFALDCYYLSRYEDDDNEKTNDTTKYVAESRLYDALKVINTEDAIKNRKNITHSYDLAAQNAAYPFALYSTTMPYYGSWPAEKAKVGLAYFETYADDETTVTGYYFDRQSTATLEDQTVESDGYVILSAAKASKITVNKDEVQGLPNTPQTVTIGNSEYYVYELPLDKCDTSKFYTAVVVTVYPEDQDNTATEAVTTTMYFNPNVAISQVNGVTKAPTNADVPSVLYVRSARQLAALDHASLTGLQNKTFLQQLDIQFSTAETDASVVATLSATNTYNGNDYMITGAGKPIFGTNNGTIMNCAVVDCGTVTEENEKRTVTPKNITGAGFIVTNAGTIENCYVSPVYGNDYRGKSNELLTITGNGFADSNSGTIKNCYVLGTVKGSAGFVDTNTGTIESCKSNVSMNSGSAFVEDNGQLLEKKGTIKNSYGWVTGTASLNTPGAKSCYFAIMKGDENALMYDANGNAQELSLDELKDTAMLHVFGAGWSTAGSSNTYPYSESKYKDTNGEPVKPVYPFPMIGDHYGDWTTGGGSLSYGILYYEKDSAGHWYVRKAIRLSGSGTSDVPYSDTTPVEENAEGCARITETGYAFYCRTGAKPFVAATNKLMGAEIVDDVNDSLHKAANLSTRYSFYKLDTSKLDANKLAVTVTGASRYNESVKSATIIPYFAEAMAENGYPLTPYKIRTQEQLQNISKAKIEKFEIDRGVYLDASFTAIPEFSGTLTATGKGQIYATELKDGLFGTLYGTVNGLKVFVDSKENESNVHKVSLAGTKGVIANVLNGGTITNCELTNIDVFATEQENIGIIVGKMINGTISNCTITGSSSVEHGVQQKNGAVGGVVGRVLGGNITNVTSAATVDASTTGYVGMFVGVAEGGTFTNCKTTAANTELNFAGDVALGAMTEVNSAATHYSKVEKANGTYAEADRTDLISLNGEIPVKPSYTVTFGDGNTMVYKDQTINVVSRTYYYNVEEIGGYKATANETGLALVPENEQVTYAQFVDLAGKSWTATQYFIRPADGADYQRLYANVVLVQAATDADGENPATEASYSFTLGYGEFTDGEPATKSEAKTLMQSELNATAIVYTEVYKVVAAPTSGKYVLANGSGMVTFQSDGKIRYTAMPGNGQIAAGTGLVWIAENGAWTNEKASMVHTSAREDVIENDVKTGEKYQETNYTVQVTNVSRGADNARTGNKVAVSVTYTITTTLTEVVIPNEGQEIRTVKSTTKTEPQVIEAYLYDLADNKDATVTLVDSWTALTLDNGTAAQRNKTLQAEAPAETTTPVAVTEEATTPAAETEETATEKSSTAPEGAAEVPAEGSEETQS